jgi:hypothetical protein
MVGSGLDEQIEDLLWRAKRLARRICGEGKDHDNDQQHDGMNVIRQESGFDTTEHGVDNNTNGEQEASSNSVLSEVRLVFEQISNDFRLTIPVKELITAAPPVNSIAVTRILVIMPKTVKTK